MHFYHLYSSNYLYVCFTLVIVKLSKIFKKVELSKRNEHVVVDDKLSQIESDIQTLKKQIQSSEDELLDLQELTDIRRSVSRAEPNLENELEDLRNELKDEIDIINDNVKKIKEDKTQKFDNIQTEINHLISISGTAPPQPVDSEMSIDHDLLESVENNMKTHMNKRLDNYVQVAEIDDMIANALARGFSPSQAATLSGPSEQSLRQLKQELQANFVLKSDFDSKLEQMDFNKPLPAPPLPSSKPPSVRTVNTDVTGVNDEWKQYVQGKRI